MDHLKVEKGISQFYPGKTKRFILSAHGKSWYLLKNFPEGWWSKPFFSMSLYNKEKMDESIYVFELEGVGVNQDNNSKQAFISLGSESKEFVMSNFENKSQTVDWNKLVDEVFR